MNMYLQQNSDQHVCAHRKREKERERLNKKKRERV